MELCDKVRIVLSLRPQLREKKSTIKSNKFLVKRRGQKKWEEKTKVYERRFQGGKPVWLRGIVQNGVYRYGGGGGTGRSMDLTFDGVWPRAI